MFTKRHLRFFGRFDRGSLGFSAFAYSADAAKPNTLTAEEIADGWLLLFDGESMYGWEPASKADWKVADGVISVSQRREGIALHDEPVGRLRLQGRFPRRPTTNSGVFLRTPKEPKDPKSDCYELNIAMPEVSPFPTGSFVGREKSSAEKFDDGWHTFEVTADKAHARPSSSMAEQVLDYTDPKPVATRAHRPAAQQRQGRVQERQAQAARI